MPTYLLRDKPFGAIYVGWSTVVEAPVFVGDEEDALRWLQRERRCDEPCCYQAQVLDRLARARRTGTSSLDGFYGYDRGGLIAEQRGVLPRECVGKYAVALLIGGNRHDADTYLQPFDDDLICVVSQETTSSEAVTDAR